MSYDFLLFRTKKAATSPADITEENADDMGSGDKLRARLSALYPDMEWEPVSLVTNRQRGTVRPDATWFRFCFDAGASNKYVSLATSFGTIDKYGFVERLCDEMGWTALDSQRGAARNLIVPRR